MADDQEEARRFNLEHTSGVAVSDDKLLDDMRRVASEYGAGSLSRPLYQCHARYSHTTVTKRFGSWNAALRAAGLPVLNEMNVADDNLFRNVEQLWVRLGRQPRKRELVAPLSTYSEGPYIRRFGSWRKALEAFVHWAESSSELDIEPLRGEYGRRKTSRDPNSALRWRVANRDGFRCRHCGKSPAMNPGVTLHIDHIVPWSQGGETVIDNLQTLCSECNIGKGTQRELDG
jgi:hypothetical protein